MKEKKVSGTFLCGMGGEREIYGGSLERFANSASLIDAYWVDWDIITFAQTLYAGAEFFVANYSDLVDSDDLATFQTDFPEYYVGLSPVGTRHKMDGPKDQRLAWSTFGSSFLKALVTQDLKDVPLIGPILIMVELHSHPSIAYGLLVTENLVGDIVVDMLGYEAYFG